MTRSAARLAALVALVIAAVPAGRAQPADVRLAGPALVADVDLLADAFETLHPGLYRYQTPDAWRARVAALRTDAAGGMSRQAFYVRLAELLGAIRCGHSYPNFFNQSAGVQAGVVEAGRRLPFHFRWTGGEMVVTRDLSGAGLAPGTRVEAVDGVAAADILARLMPLARADGGTDAKRREILSVSGGERYEAFDVYFPLVFALRDSVEVRVRAPLGGATRTLRLATQAFAEREALRTAAPPAATAGTAGATPLGWTLRTLPDGTAVLAMPSWATWDARWDWKAFLDSTVAALAGTPRLVIDLRDSEGGSDDIADVLLGYLAREPVTFPATERYVRYRTLPDRLRPYADTWDRRFDDWSASVAPGEAGDLLRLARPDGGAAGKTIRPDSLHFAGRVAVLVGPVNSSATFAFAQDVQRSGLARLVGQTTGGNQRGINGSAFYFFRLPGSGVEVDLPLVGTYPPGRDLTGVPDAGVEPDVAVPVDADDLATGRDRTLEAAVAALSE